MRRFRSIHLLVGRLFAVSALALAATGVPASQVRPVNLEQMTVRAARIFSGHCLSTETSFDPALGAKVVVTTFEVERSVKGDRGRTVTVRMPGGDEVGVVRFRPGEEVVLFLYEESALGFSSPVGLGQGRFEVVTDKLGRRIAVNDVANRGLFTGLTPEARTRLSSSLQTAEEDQQLSPEALLDLTAALTQRAP